MNRGQLVVVGTGIQLVAHMTHESRQYIESADKVFFVVTNSALAEWICTLNPRAEALNPLYAPGKPRLETYHEMADSILAAVRAGMNVCAVFYGHPGVFVYPSHRAIKVAREEGYQAIMKPGVSAEDCLFADLGFDPAAKGCQSYEATDFLLRERIFDPRAALILWQVGVISDNSVRPKGTFNRQGVETLTEVLCDAYPVDHEVIVYQAAQYNLFEARVETVELAKLPEANIVPISTLYVPPLAALPKSPEMMNRLGVKQP